MRQYLYAEGLKNILIAKDLALHIGDSIKYYRYLADEMHIHNRAGNYNNAIKGAKEILEVYRFSATLVNKEKIAVDVMHLYNSIGVFYRNVNELNSASYYFLLSENLAKEIGDKFWTMLARGNRGGVYVSQKKYEEAIPLLLTDFRTSIAYKEYLSAVFATDLIAYSYLSLGNLKKAGIYLDSSQWIIQTHGMDTLSGYWKIKSEYEFARKRYVDAWNYRNLYLEASIAEIKKKELANVMRIQSSYTLELKQKEIDNLISDAETRNRQLELQRYVLVAGFIGVVLLLLLALGVIRNYKKQKKINKVIQQHQNETQQAHEELNTAYNELKLAQQHLVQSEKMAFLGRLTSNIAHEINSPLAAIKASSNNIQNSVSNIRRDFLKMVFSMPTDCIRLVPDIMKQINTVEHKISFSQERELRIACVASLKEDNISNSLSLAEYLVGTGLYPGHEKWLPLLRIPEAVNFFKLVNDVVVVASQNANISMAVARASKILFALKSYSHPGSPDGKINISVVDTIEVVLTIYGNTLKGVDVIRNYDNTLITWGEPEELGQVWTNLIHNAVQAMHSNGKLTVLVAWYSDSEVKVEFTDTGEGILPENLSKLFQPFFTTKPVGEGTGLGLSIVKKIIEKHNGRIECESKVGEGTTFRVFLPRVTIQ